MTLFISKIASFIKILIKSPRKLGKIKVKFQMMSLLQTLIEIIMLKLEKTWELVEPTFQIKSSYMHLHLGSPYLTQKIQY